MFWEMVWFIIKEIFKMLMAGLILFLIMGGLGSLKKSFNKDPKEYYPYLIGLMTSATRIGRRHR